MSTTKAVAELQRGDVIVGTPAGPMPVRGVTPLRRSGRQIGWRISGGRCAGWTTPMEATVEVADVDLATAWVVRRVMRPTPDCVTVGYWNRHGSQDGNPTSPMVRVFVSAVAAQTALDGAYRSLTERRHWTPVPRADAIRAYVERYGPVPA